MYSTALVPSAPTVWSSGTIADASCSKVARSSAVKKCAAVAPPDPLRSLQPGSQGTATTVPPAARSWRKVLRR